MVVWDFFHQQQTGTTHFCFRILGHVHSFVSTFHYCCMVSFLSEILVLGLQFHLHNSMCKISTLTFAHCLLVLSYSCFYLKILLQTHWDKLVKNQGTKCHQFLCFVHKNQRTMLKNHTTCSWLVLNPHLAHLLITKHSPGKQSPCLMLFFVF